MAGGESGYTIEQQMACVKREIAMRKNVYPKWVMSGRMKPEAADHEINCLIAVLRSLETLVDDVPQP
jgi:hypothetical protein